MKVLFSLLCTVLTLGMTLTLEAQSFDPSKNARWYGNNSLRLELAGKIIHIDPVSTPTSEKADIILITHSHKDHFAPTKIKKLSSRTSKVLAGFADLNLPRIKVGEIVEIGEITIEALPMYDLHSEVRHDKSIGFTGFLIKAAGTSIYVSGDIGRMPELQNIQCDFAFLPLGPAYTMLSVQDAVDAALDLHAKTVIPVHFGTYEGTDADADTFVTTLKAKGVNALKLPRSDQSWTD